MANVSSSNGLEKRPKLRFPGFDDPWKAEKLSDFAERVTRRTPITKRVCLSQFRPKMGLWIRSATSIRP